MAEETRKITIITTDDPSPETTRFEGEGVVRMTISDNALAVGLLDGSENGLRESVQSVKAADTLYRLEDGFISGCQSIRKFSAGKNTKAVGDKAFAYCGNLDSVSFLSSPEQLMHEFGNRSFEGCESLAGKIYINLSGSSRSTFIGDYCFAGCENITDVEWTKSSYIGKRMFDGCTSLSSLTLPAYTSYVYEEGFAGMPALSSVVLPRNIWMLNDRLFQDDTALTSVVVEEGMSGSVMSRVGDSVFAGCSKLSSFTLPKSITTWQQVSQSFLSGSSITSLTFQGMGDDMFGGGAQDVVQAGEYITTMSLLNTAVDAAVRTGTPVVVFTTKHDFAAEECPACKNLEERLASDEWKTYFSGKSGQVYLCKAEFPDDMWTIVSTRWSENDKNINHLARYIDGNPWPDMHDYAKILLFRYDPDTERASFYAGSVDVKMKNSDYIDLFDEYLKPPVVTGGGQIFQINGREYRTGHLYEYANQNWIGSGPSTGWENFYYRRHLPKYEKDKILPPDCDMQDIDNIAYLAKNCGVPIFVEFGAINCGDCVNNRSVMRDSYYKYGVKNDPEYDDKSKGDFHGLQESDKISDMQEESCRGKTFRQLIKDVPAIFVSCTLHHVRDDGGGLFSLFDQYFRYDGTVPTMFQYYADKESGNVYKRFSHDVFGGVRDAYNEILPQIKNAKVRSVGATSSAVTKLGSPLPSVTFISNTGKKYDISADAAVGKPEYRVDAVTDDEFKYGIWYWNAEQLKTYADEHHIPVFAKFGTEGCMPCRRFDADIFQDDFFEDFVQNSKYMYCKVDPPDTKAYKYGQPYFIDAMWAQKSPNYAPPNNAIPLLMWYWNKGDGDIVWDLSTYHFTPGEKPPEALDSSSKIIRLIREKFSGYEGDDEMIAPPKTAFAGGNGFYYEPKPPSSDQDGRYFVFDAKQKILTYSTTPVKIEFEYEDETYKIQENSLSVGQELRVPDLAYMMYTDIGVKDRPYDKALIFRTSNQSVDFMYYAENIAKNDEGEEIEVFPRGDWYVLDDLSDGQEIAKIQHDCSETSRVSKKLLLFELSVGDPLTDRWITEVKPGLSDYLFYNGWNSYWTPGDEDSRKLFVQLMERTPAENQESGIRPFKDRMNEWAAENPDDMKSPIPADLLDHTPGVIAYYGCANCTENDNYLEIWSKFRLDDGNGNLSSAAEISAAADEALGIV